MRCRLFPLFACMSLVASAAPSNPPTGPVAPGGPVPEATKDVHQEKPVEPVTKEASVEINGKRIPYKVTAGTLQLKEEDGKDKAAVFHVSYQRTDVKDAGSRPVMFAFNGGPGSSAVWLHIGVLGPKIVKLPGDGTTAPLPPARVMDNPMSILDVCDLVFVDPISTGYSRSGKDVKADQFHGLEGDIQSVGDFVRRWVTENDRWSSPKFLLGESYGGIRVAGLSHHLQSRYGMNLNGVVLLSSLLDFGTLRAAQGNDLTYMVYLPALTGTAHFHKKITGDRDELVKASTEFAFGEYAAALMKGVDLDDATKKSVAEKLSSFSGIPAEKWIENNLRLDSTAYRAELLRSEGKVIGRFDARVAWAATDQAAAYPDYDPSYSLAYGAFSTALMDYMGRELGYKDHRPYEILTSKVQPWRWDSDNRVVNLSSRLGTAMRDNPHMKILVMGGYTDLATPPEGVAYSLRHMLNLPESARENITTTFYDGGHMFYLNPPDLTKCRKDLVEFINSSLPPQ